MLGLLSRLRLLLGLMMLLGLLKLLGLMMLLRLLLVLVLRGLLLLMDILVAVVVAPTPASLSAAAGVVVTILGQHTETRASEPLVQKVDLLRETIEGHLDIVGDDSVLSVHRSHADEAGAEDLGAGKQR